MTALVTLSPESVEAVARRVVELQSGTVVRSDDPNALLTREQAATYCSLTVYTFDRERKRLPEALKPAADKGPLARRWRRSTLDLYKMTNGEGRYRTRRKAA